MSNKDVYSFNRTVPGANAAGFREPESDRPQPEPAIIPRLVGGWNCKCSKCGRSFSSSTDFHTHIAQGCR